MVGGLLVVAAGAAFLASMDADPSYLTDVLPGFIVIGLGTGPDVRGHLDRCHERHPPGAVRARVRGDDDRPRGRRCARRRSLTAIAGDLTTRAGLIGSYPTVFSVIAVAMVALSAFVAFAVPRVQTTAGVGGHGHGMH